MSDAVEDTVIIKSRKRPRGSLRQNRPEDDDEDLEIIQQVRNFQEIRAKPQGKLANTAAKKGSKLGPKCTSSFIEKSIVADEEDQVRLSRTFASETNKRDEDAEMLKYIEQELAKHKGQGSEDSNQQDSSKASSHSLLKQIPEDLRPVIGQHNEELLSNQMLCGIPEFDLGVDAKMRNIESTEFAKQKLLKQRLDALSSTDEKSLIPCNMSVNFLQQRAANENDITLNPFFGKPHSLNRDRDAGIQNNESESKAKPATDDKGQLNSEVRRLQRERATDNLAMQRFRNHARAAKRF